MPRDEQEYPPGWGLDTSNGGGEEMMRMAEDLDDVMQGRPWWACWKKPWEPDVMRTAGEWGAGGLSWFHTEMTADSSREENGFKIWQQLQFHSDDKERDKNLLQYCYTLLMLRA